MDMPFDVEVSIKATYPDGTFYAIRDEGAENWTVLIKDLSPPPLTNDGEITIQVSTQSFAAILALWAGIGELDEELGYVELSKKLYEIAEPAIQNLSRNLRPIP